MKHLSYRLRLSFIIILVAIIPIAVFFVSYVRSEKAKWERNALMEYFTAVESNSQSLDNLILEMKQKAVYITNNANVSSALVDVTDHTLIEDMDLLMLLRDVARMVSADNQDMKIHWYSDKNVKNYADFYRPMETLDVTGQEKELMERVLQLRSGEILFAYRVKEEYGQTDSYLCAYTKMNAMEKGQYLLEICVPVRKVIDLAALQEGVLGLQLTQNGVREDYLLSEGTPEGQSVWEQYAAKDKKQDYYEIVSSLNNAPESSLIFLLSQSYVASLIVADWFRFVVIVLVVLLLLVFSAYAAVTVFTGRLNEFLDKVNKKLDDILTEEEGDVAADFAGIEKKIMQLVRNTKEYEAENNRLELELLQMRFNPHFLYNTLIGIRYQIHDEEIRKSIDSLIRYYRIVLSKGHLIIKVAEEIEMIEEYLKVELFIYHLSNIRYHIDVEERAKEVMIVKHLLQPIVENALEHGVRAKEDGGDILIRVKLSEKDVIFEIEDNGVGMTPQQIKGVLEAPSYDSMGGGYGIYNVQQRIETYYGKKYGITFQSTVGQGTIARIRIPQVREEVSKEKEDEF